MKNRLLSYESHLLGYTTTGFVCIGAPGDEISQSHVNVSAKQESAPLTYAVSGCPENGPVIV